MVLSSAEQETCRGHRVAEPLPSASAVLTVAAQDYTRAGRRIGPPSARALLVALQLHPPFTKECVVMLSWALAFFIIAIIAAVFGFTGIAAGAAEIAKILFVVFVVLFLVSLVAGLLRRP
jgi:uncharacterized membrane protein YtjA (UPF0391 family)